ncbi:TetR family transcriptional regulator [Cellulomonas sp. ES6]|uniref:TetR/AcrR family transcriptional regulator n=1 Tax=Cellulomonas sp. ES6 TaxID=3039384 RepID=UPI0019CC5DF3|nr:TetR family transcriptional regulator [Cellulomonas sp. ES6]MBD3780628.1 TetR family transcriptional regulator [Micrococcales bacterium]WHP19319.1 TetR family transcriptional regulator [Cellulomonas sp. ES6]
MAVGDRRRALVDATVRVIARDGVAGATTRAVVAEAGMSLASLHYAFPSRDHLLEAVVADVTAQERRTAEAGLLPLDDDDAAGTGAGTLEEVVRDGLERYVGLLVADPDRERALLELALYAMRAPGQRAALVAQYDVYRTAARASLTAAARATGSRWTVPLDDAARALVMVTDGITTAWLADHDTPAALRSAAFAARSLAALAEPVAGRADPDSPDPDLEDARAH